LAISKVSVNEPSTVRADGGAGDGPAGPETQPWVARPSKTSKIAGHEVERPNISPSLWRSVDQVTPEAPRRFPSAPPHGAEFDYSEETGRISAVMSDTSPAAEAKTTDPAPAAPTEAAPTEAAPTEAAQAAAAPTEPAFDMARRATELAVLDSLRAVVDPELGLDIVDLALIRQIIIGSESSEIKMVLTTPFCPYAGSMIQQIKDQAESVLEHPVKVTVLAERWDPRDAGLMW
jgi:metal-sulfur cluster biosynthetic enzyme